MNSDNENNLIDKISLQHRREENLDETPVDREIRLNKLKAAVRAGTYQIDTEKVAKALERDLFRENTDEE